MNIKESDAPKNSMLQDPVGDTSSKRVAGFVSLFVAMVIAIFVCIMASTGKNIPASDLIESIFYGLLFYSGTAFALTLPEHWSKTLKE